MTPLAQIVANTDPMTAEDELDALAKDAARLILSSDMRRDCWILVWARVFVLLELEEQLDEAPTIGPAHPP